MNIQDSVISIGSGSLVFFDEAEVIFADSFVTIVDGNLNAQGNADTKINNCDFSISGSFITQNYANLLIQDSSFEITGGNLQLLDSGSFSIFKSTVNIHSGDFIANNDESSTIKYISFVDTDVNIFASDSENPVGGNMDLLGNVDVTLLGSDFIIDGSLNMLRNSRLFVHSASSFLIPTGVVTMDETSTIDISADSSFINQGTLFAPGTIGFPTGSTVSNAGYMETSHPLSVNCEADSVSENAFQKQRFFGLP